MASVSPTQKPEVKKIWWAPFLAIAATILIFYSANFFGRLLISIYPVVIGDVVGQFLLVFFIEAFVVWLLWVILKRSKRSFKSLGLNQPQYKHVLYAVGAFLIYLPLLIMVLTAVKSLIPTLDLEQEQQIGFETAQGASLILVGLSLVLLPAVTEELLMRGFLYQRLKNSWPKWLAALITSSLFALAHLQFGSSTPLLWAAAIDTFILSLVLIVLLEKSGSLWACIWLHMIKNGLAFLTLFVLR